ncbi:MAG: DUF6460 domain-containing protein [Hyphomicrobium sp.]
MGLIFWSTIRLGIDNSSFNMWMKMKEIDWKTILGGRPLSILFRLILTSIVVGIVLDTLGINLRNFFYRFHELLRFVYDLGLDAVHWVFDYFLLGAILVVPLWILSRLLKIFPSKG